MKEIPEIDNFLNFYINNIFFNSYKYYEPNKTLFDILITLIEGNPNITKKFIEKIQKIMEFINQNKYDVNLKSLSSTSKFRGLRNLGATCYINSTLQQIFNITKMKKLVLEHDFEKDNDWSTQLQNVFSKLEFFPSTYIDPSCFINLWTGWDGEPINPHEQQDAVEFLQMLLERLEEKDKSLTTMFKGQIVHNLIGRSHDYQSERIEEFTILPLEVKDHTNVEESLKTFLIPDKFDGNNQYKVDDIGLIDADLYHKVRISPEILILQLKRFEYNMSNNTREKVNSYYIFPHELDIGIIMENQESQIYDLIGIVMHMGSAQAGHYFSHVKRDDGKWYTFNDIRVNRCDGSTLPEESAGGKTNQVNWGYYGSFKKEFYDKDQNAYLLFYKKRTQNIDQQINDYDINQECLKRIDEEIKYSILDSIVASPNFSELVLKLCEADKDGKFIYSIYCHNLSTNSDVKATSNLALQCMKLLEENKDFCLHVLTQTKEIDEFLIRNINNEMRSSFSIFIITAINNIQENEKLNQFAQFLISKMDILMNYFGNFNEFFNVFNELQKKIPNLIDKVIEFLLVIIPNYDQTHTQKKIYEIIDLSSIFNMLIYYFENNNNSTENTEKMKKLFTKENIINWTKSSKHDKSFSKLMSILLKDNGFTSNVLINLLNEKLGVKQISSLFIIVFSCEDSLSKQRCSTFINFIKEKEILLELSKRIHPMKGKLCKNFNESFLPEFKNFFCNIKINRQFNDFVYSVYSQFPKISETIVEGEDKTLFHELFVTLVNLRKIFDTVKKPDSEIDSIICNYYDMLSWAMITGGFKDELYQFSNDFISSLKKFNDNQLTKGYSKCLSFIFNLINTNPQKFFETSSFTKFLSSVKRLNPDNSIRLIELIKNSNKYIEFIKSETFLITLSSSLKWNLVLLAITNLIKSNVNQQNCELTCSVLWTPQIFETSLTTDSIEYYQISWYILKKYPQTADFFYKNKLYLSLIKRIDQEIKGKVTYRKYDNYMNPVQYVKTIRKDTLKAKANLLAKFNNAYTTIIKDKKGFFGKRKSNSLSKEWKQILDLAIIYKVSIDPSVPTCKGSGGLCNLLSSLVNMDYIFCKQIFDSFAKQKQSILSCFPYDSQKSGAKFLVTLIIHLISKEPERIVEANKFIAKEFMSFACFSFNNFSVIQILCDQLQNMMQTMVNTDQIKTVGEAINCIYESTTDPLMFGSSIFRVALKIPNPNPVKWQQKAGGLLREEIRKGLYMNVEPKNEIEKNRANVDILLNFINKICQTFNLQIQNIGVSLQDMMKLAEKYQAIEAIEFSESASELVTFGTMLDE